MRSLSGLAYSTCVHCRVARKASYTLEAGNDVWPVVLNFITVIN